LWKPWLLPACLLLEIRWQKGRRAAAPSNFLSLPSTQFVKNKQIPHMGSTYTGEKRRGGLWAKHTGLRRGAIGNTLGEHIGNIWNLFGFWLEPIWNLKGTCWEQRENEKILPPKPKT
jgi:hypothetical protein